MKMIVAALLVASLTGCASMACPDQACRDGRAERMSAVLMNYSNQQFQRASDLRATSTNVFAVPKADSTYTPYVPGPVQTSKGTTRCQLVQTPTPGVTKQVCWTE